ncbi:4006_t:CDS:2, partial [Cetraspora pellucida]
NKKKKLKTNKENVVSLEVEKIQTSDNSQKEKLVLKEAFYENLASQKQHETDTLKSNINTTIDDTYEKQATTYNMLENRKTITQSLDNIENENGNELLDNIQETNPYTKLQE